jgi:hypothetical protein
MRSTRSSEKDELGRATRQGGAADLDRRAGRRAQQEHSSTMLAHARRGRQKETHLEEPVHQIGARNDVLNLSIGTSGVQRLRPHRDARRQHDEQRGWGLSQGKDKVIFN